MEGAGTPLNAQSARLPGHEAPAEGAPFDLVVADASWSWTERLFTPMSSQGVNVLLLRISDWRTALEQRRPWSDWRFPRSQPGPHLWRQTLILPPGWMKTYPRLGMKPIAWSIRAWRRSLPAQRPLVLAISYPHYLHLSPLVQPASLVYYNMDDYALYWPQHAGVVRALERQVVQQADLSVFCAKLRAEKIGRELPQAADRIIHLPHGAPEESIAPEPVELPAAPPPDLDCLPRPYLGFVGSLEDRLDWPLLERLARERPESSMILIGRRPAFATVDWYKSFERVERLPNVHLLGWKSQQEIGRYMAAFDVCLIPYRTDHPFNEAACPTKIMDYMATTRPVVATALPECRLYSHLFRIAADSDAFLRAIDEILKNGSRDELARARWEFARHSTWGKTSDRLREMIAERLPGNEGRFKKPHAETRRRGEEE